MRLFCAVGTPSGLEDGGRTSSSVYAAAEDAAIAIKSLREAMAAVFVTNLRCLLGQATVAGVGIT
jgi:hypothetical protein